MNLIIKSNKHGDKLVSLDEEDFELIGRENTWVLHKRNEGNFYAYTQKKKNGHRQKIYMHRLIMGFPIGYDIDHKDGNGLNNCKHNLRIATRSNNCAAQHRKHKNPTGFKGVHLEKSTGNYFALLMVNRKRKVKQGFKTPLEAAKKYNEFAKQYYGEFASLNIIPND